MRLGLLAAAIFAMAASVSEASVFFSIERISNSDAKIIGSGEFDFFVDKRIGLINATEPGPNSLAGFSGTMNAGAQSLIGAGVEGVTLTLLLEFDDNIPVGADLSGHVFMTLAASAWGPIGTTGAAVDAPSGNLIGRFEIVPVPIPLPAAGASLAAGLAVFAALRARRTRGRRAAPTF